MISSLIKSMGRLQLVLLVVILTYFAVCSARPFGIYEDIGNWNTENSGDPRLHFLRGIAKRAGDTSPLCRLGIDQWGTICCKKPVYGQCSCMGGNWAQVDFC